MSKMIVLDEVTLSLPSSRRLPVHIDNDVHHPDRLARHLPSVNIGSDSSSKAAYHHPLFSARLKEGSMLPDL
jgi:hypothetical protein